jgi:hypothetical protein
MKQITKEHIRTIFSVLSFIVQITMLLVTLYIWHLF